MNWRDCPVNYLITSAQNLKISLTLTKISITYSKGRGCYKVTDCNNVRISRNKSTKIRLNISQEQLQLIHIWKTVTVSMVPISLKVYTYKHQNHLTTYSFIE